MGAPERLPMEPGEGEKTKEGVYISYVCDTNNNHVIYMSYNIIYQVPGTAVCTRYRYG